MSIVIRIDAEAGTAKREVAALETSLNKTTDAAKRTQGEVARATTEIAGAGGALATAAKAGDSAAASIHKTAAAASSGGDALSRLDDLVAKTNAELVQMGEVVRPLESGFGRLVEQVEREASILERIRGPLREFRADMDTLDDLLQRGKVSAAEYDTELQRLIRTSGTMQGPVHQPELGPKQAPATNEATAAAAAFGALNAQFQREADILERIRAPMREYRADLDALDVLYKRNQLSALEYEEEVQRLVKAQGTLHGPVQQQAAPAALGERASSTLGGIGGAVAGVTGMVGGIVAVGAAFDGLIAKAHEVEDTYIDLTNAGRKFTDATHTTDQVLDEQRQLAHDLQSGLGGTIDAYDAIRDGTDELNLSHREQIRLTKSLGEAVQISGKSLDQAGSIMSKLSYAMASGRIEGGELREIMREVPDIASLWTSSFGVTRQELVRMVSQGKITTEQLTHALINDTKELDANFAKRERKNAQSKEEWLLNEKLLSQRHDVALGSGQQAEVMDRLTNAGTRNFQAMIAGFNAAVDGMTAASARAGAAVDKHIAKSVLRVIDLIPTMASRFTDAVDAIGRRSGVLSDPWGDDRNGFAAQMGLLSQIKGPANEAKIQLENLNAVFKAGAISSDEYAKRYKELVTAMNDGQLPETIKLWEQLNEPTKQWSLTIGALNALLRAGRIDAQQYNEELAKLVQSNPARSGTQPPGFVGGRSMGGVELAIGYDAPAGDAGPRKTVQDENAAVPVAGFSQDYAAELDRVFAIASKTEEPLRVYRQAVDDIREALALQLITQAQANDMTAAAAAAYKQTGAAISGMNPELARQQQILEQLAAPAKAYNTQLADLDALLGRGAISADQYGDAIDKVRAAYLAGSDEGKTFGGGIEQEWLKLKAGAEDFGATVAGVVVSNVDQLNNALIEAANGGEVSWGKMADAMLQDLERVLLKQLEIQAISALIGTSTGSPAGIGGLPGFANGGSMIVGDSGGTDSQVVAFRATPGEQLIVRTPQQQAQAAAAQQPPAAAPSVSQNTRVVNVLDPSVVHAAIDSPAGHRVVLNIIRANQAAVRSYSGTRR